MLCIKNSRIGVHMKISLSALIKHYGLNKDKKQVAEDLGIDDAQLRNYSDKKISKIPKNIRIKIMILFGVKKMRGLNKILKGPPDATSVAQLKERNDSKDAYRHFYSYNIGRHRVALIFWMIGLFLLSVIVGAIISGGIYELLHMRCDMGDKAFLFADRENHESGCLDIKVLPDLLGGMIGILMGFILEWLVFEKIKHISKYQAILSCLKIEFKKILVTLRSTGIWTVNEIVLDDIVLSAENSIILNNLPGCALFKKFRGSEEIFSLLQEIHGNIERRNRALEEKEKGIIEELNYWKIQNPNAQQEQKEKMEKELRGDIKEPELNGTQLSSLIQSQINQFNEITPFKIFERK